MRTSANGSAIIRAFESCLKGIGGGQFTTYYCPAGVLTIGWGTTASDYPALKKGEIWTQAKCDDVFARSLGSYEAAVLVLESQRARDGHGTLTPYQFDALVSFVYNCGAGALSGNVGRAVREGRDSEVPEFLARWNKGGGKVLAGLVRRRKAEGQLYRGDFTGASATAQTILPGDIGRTREVPRPTGGELVKRTPGLAGGAAAGGGTATGTVATKESPNIGGQEAAMIAGGLMLALVCIVVMVHRWEALKKDWH